MIKSQLRHAIAAAFAIAAAAPGAAFAVYEAEPNEPAMSAQPLVTVKGVSTVVTGAVGVTSRTVAPVGDVDFYSFEATKGDLVVINIDGGMKNDPTTRSVDTIIAVFGADLGAPLRDNDDASSYDTGSPTSLSDSRIDNFLVPADGTYYVGVSSYPRRFVNANTLSSSSLNTMSNGSYTLTISGATAAPQILPVNIDIRPGDDEITEINPKWRRHIPVALLSTETFDATEVNIDSLTFGATGNEKSLYHCRVDDGDDDRKRRHHRDRGHHRGHHKHTTDVNRDGLLDLLCHFDVQDAGFDLSDSEGVMMGVAPDGRKFEGRAFLKVVPQKKKHRHHNNRHRNHGDRDD
jgi:hypothetical protein